MNTIRPHLLWLLLAPVFAGVGFVGFFVLLFIGLSDIGADMTRLSIPGRHTVELKAGRTLIFLESRSVLDGKPVASEANPEALRVEITTADGEALRVEPVRATTSYKTPDYEGSSVFYVLADHGGPYLLHARWAEGYSGGSGVVALGAIDARVATAVLRASVLLALGLTAALVTVAVILIRRRNAAKALAAM